MRGKFLLQTTPHTFLILQFPDLRKRRIQTPPGVLKVNVRELATRLPRDCSRLDTMTNRTAL